jgi:sporulation-control protein spo0M
VSPNEALTVRAESPVTVPGGTVRAVVTITGEPDHKVRGATVRLVRNALYKMSVTNVTDHGSHDTLLHNDAVIAEVPLTDSSGRVVSGDHAVSFALPDDALPSVPRYVPWSVEAVIDRHHGIDVKAQAPVDVRSGPELFAEEATSEAIPIDGPGVELELPIRSLRPGETITGKVRVRPERALTVTRVTVNFNRCVGTAKGHDFRGIVPFKVLLDDAVDEPLDLQAGDTRTFPFELTLPEDAEPTVLGLSTTPPCSSVLYWTVVAIATHVLSPGEKRDGRPAVQLGINVYNAPVAPLHQNEVDNHATSDVDQPTG